MIALALALHAGATTAPLIVFQARFYSHYESVSTHPSIYMSSANGKGRKLIYDPKKGESMDEPFWISPERIVWLVGDDNDSKARYPCAVWTYNVKTRKTSIVKRIDLAKEQPKETFSIGPTSSMYGRKINLWALKDGSYGKVDPKTDRWQTASKPAIDPQRIVPAKGIHLVRSNPKVGPWSFEIQDYDHDLQGYLLSANKDSVHQPLKSPSNLEFYEVFDLKQDNSIYVESVFYEHENHYQFARFNWKTGKLDEILPECCSFDFRPGRRWYSYTGFRQVQPLGHDRRSVWSHDLWIGDFKTGKKWKLFPRELMEIDSVAFQPAN